METLGQTEAAVNAACRLTITGTVRHAQSGVAIEGSEAFADHTSAGMKSSRGTFTGLWRV